MFDGELSFALKLAREMGRPDWRAMLAGMSSTEYADWHRFYSTHYFHDVLLDMHFSGLTYTVLSLFFSEPDMDVASAPSVRKVRFGDGYSQRAPAGLNADLKTYSVTFSVPRWEAMALESFLAEHGGWKAFLWTPPYEWRQIKVTCAKWSSRVSMLRVEFSAEFEQVVN
ncbi:phage tail assembly protein T [Escherichia coli]|nr:phage tail assembly protein T [Escherichia coli]